MEGRVTVGLPSQGVCEASADPAGVSCEGGHASSLGGTCCLLVGTEGLWIFVLFFGISIFEAVPLGHERTG